ncbi:MAG: DUF3842 family protein [Lentisphaeria bacterium]|nr:DUF3842 family protein [Lentisphaeria bacterium]
MKILVIDGQGGGIGKSLIAQLKLRLPDCRIIAVGTNSIAASVMKKAGADIVATGENAVRVNARNADIITGPVGIIAADALYGEISGEMANAVARSEADKVLIPFNNCGIFIVGISAGPPAELLAAGVEKIVEIVNFAAKNEKNTDFLEK